MRENRSLHEKFKKSQRRDCCGTLRNADRGREPIRKQKMEGNRRSLRPRQHSNRNSQEEPIHYTHGPSSAYLPARHGVATCPSQVNLPFTTSGQLCPSLPVPEFVSCLWSEAKSKTIVLLALPCRWDCLASDPRCCAHLFKLWICYPILLIFFCHAFEERSIFCRLRRTVLAYHHTFRN